MSDTFASLLNLSEFDDKALPMNPKLAQDCRRTDSENAGLTR